MHSHTLSRRLKALGTSYQELLDESRFEVARQLLKHSRMEISEIAGMLDYAGARSFIRAFRRWSGTTPARWRVRRPPAKLRTGTTTSDRILPV
jgi:AraC-like DNA-binding protein